VWVQRQGARLFDSFFKYYFEASEKNVKSISKIGEIVWKKKYGG
jgi:hypothetical protein